VTLPLAILVSNLRSLVNTNRIGLSIVANKKELQTISEILAIIDNPEDLNCGIDAVMR